MFGKPPSWARVTGGGRTLRGEAGGINWARVDAVSLKATGLNPRTAELLCSGSQR